MITKELLIQAAAILDKLSGIVNDHRPDDKTYLEYYPEVDHNIDAALEESESMAARLLQESQLL